MSRHERPWRENAVAWLVGKGLVWLGKRAWDRGDRHDYDRALAALRAGNDEEQA